MGHIFHEENPLVLAVKKIFGMFLLNFLWLLCCIPLFTVGPATVAFCDAAHHEIRLNGGQPFSRFFTSVRRNWRQALPIGGLVVVISAAQVIDIILLHISLSHGAVLGNLWVIFAISLAFTAAYALWIFTYIATFDAPTKTAMKNSLLLMIAHLPATLMIVAVIVIAVLCIYLLPGTLFLTPTLCVLLSTRLIHRVFDRYRETDDMAAERPE